MPGSYSQNICIVIELPSGDADYAVRWRLIKMGFSKSIPPKEWCSKVRQRRDERGIWQRRYWEHQIQSESNYQAHMDYVHFNPVKHGLVAKVGDWPYSTFHRQVEQDVYPTDWGGGEEKMLTYED